MAGKYKRDGKKLMNKKLITIDKADINQRLKRDRRFPIGTGMANEWLASTHRDFNTLVNQYGLDRVVKYLMER